MIRLPFRDSVEVVLVPDSVAQRGPDWSAPEILPVAGLHYGVPLRFTYSFGITRGQAALATGDYRGWVVVIESGAGGGTGRVGFVRAGRHLGAELAGAVLYTDRRALTVAPDQSYAGAQARIFLDPITVTLGGYGRVDGTAPGDGRLFSVSIGVGY